METLHICLAFTFIFLPLLFLDNILSGNGLKYSLSVTKWFAIIFYILFIIYSIYGCNNPSLPVEDNIIFIE